MESSSPLPEAIESELARLLEGPEAELDAGVARLGQQHPGMAAKIEATARQARDLLGGERATNPNARTDRSADGDLGPGDRIGPFVVRGEIGRGGMGSVYLAEQRAPVTRRVALKVIKLGMDTKAVLARFEAERQALAMMDHSCIARVYEAGATPQGRPYFAMEYVKGMPITRYCDEHKLSVEDRLALFRQVCSGVQHAHTKGVIHRDLTPNNVLVTLQDGNPTAKIIDFGLARATDHRLTEKTIYTEQGVILGTPEYMSPEQAGLNELDVDMRSDVYTLGVLLYELLTGALPFTGPQLRAAGYDKMCAIIRTQEPEKPSTKVTKQAPDTEAIAKLRRTDSGKLVRRLRGDLDWIVLKCLEKDRTRRYETVSQLSEDVQRHLQHDLVLARAPSVGYRLLKLTQRYRSQLLAAGLLLLSLVAGLAATTVFMLRAQESEARALRSASKAREQEAIAQEQARAAETARAGQAQRAWEAAENAATAQRNAQEAQRNAAEALARKREFDQLAGVVSYERAIAAEKKLYPAWPAQIEAMRRWLEEDAGKLLAMRPQLEETVQDLRGRALPATPQEAEHDRTTHPRLPEWRQSAAKLAAFSRANAIRTDAQAFTLPPLTTEEQAMTPSALNALAWPRVTPETDKRVWGEEARALALAKLAWQKATDLPAAERTSFGDTLAWAWLANGKDEEARMQSEAALALAAADKRAEHEHYRTKLHGQIAVAQGEAGAKAVAVLRASVARLEAEVMVRRTHRFADESQRFLHDALSELLGKLALLDGNERRAVEERLGWAQRIEALTLGHPRATVTWQAARAAIARADGVEASTLYRVHPIDLKPQVGLVPIGMNPATKLWEFYELRSAWDGEHDAEAIEIPLHVRDGERAGHIEMKDGTGIVFVLLPGGMFSMGSQSDDPKRSHYDAQRSSAETLHEVRLSPFFLARHELTQGQWRRMTGREPSYYKAGAFRGGRPVEWSNPVEEVDWSECDTWLWRYGLELPTEAQWEHGCRAGTTTPWVCALAELKHHANLADATGKRVIPAWRNYEEWTDDRALHAPVGCFAPNAYGLFDVHGNVWEWTRDGDFGASARPRAGDGLRGEPSDSSLRVARGGSFNSTAFLARSAHRGRFAPSIRDDNIGVRPARSLQP